MTSIRGATDTVNKFLPERIVRHDLRRTFSTLADVVLNGNGRMVGLLQGHTQPQEEDKERRGTAITNKYSSGLGPNISAALGAEARLGQAGHTRADLLPSFCLSSVLGDAVYSCTAAPVADQSSLESLLERVRRSFEVVVEPCAAADQRTALEIMEHVFFLTAAQARAALAEATAGFPVSGGNFAVWLESRIEKAASSGQ